MLRGAVIGVVVLLLARPPDWLADLVSPGIAVPIAVGVLVASLSITGALVTALPFEQRRTGSWRPGGAAIPVTVAVWWWREPLTEWIASGGGARTAVVAAMILLGLLSLAEVALATSIVGAFFAPDATILSWYAVPALAGLMAGLLLLQLLPRSAHSHSGLQVALRALRGLGARSPFPHRFRPALHYAGPIEIMIGSNNRSGLAVQVRNRPDLLTDDALHAVDMMFDDARAEGDDLRADQLAVIHKFLSDARVDGAESALGAIPECGPLMFQAPRIS